jgi:hypothetical protein
LPRIVAREIAAEQGVARKKATARSPCVDLRPHVVGHREDAMMRRLPAWISWGAALVCAAMGCGEPGDNSAAPSANEAGAITEGLSLTCSSTRSLVCGTDGRTYLNSCRAGGWRHIAHFGACADFVCSGTVCASGFTCRSFTVFGVPTDQCVSNTGTAPACSCAANTHCVQDPSGAVHCEADPPPAPPTDPSTACLSKVCPSGQHCGVITVYGVPTASCLFN